MSPYSNRHHWPTSSTAVLIEALPCTAPTEAEYIAELEDKIKMIEARGGGDWLDDLEAELAEARKLAEEHQHYTSTACHHGQHNACRLQCKFCTQACRCVCHSHRKTDQIKPTYQELEKLADERGAALARAMSVFEDLDTCTFLRGQCPECLGRLHETRNALLGEHGSNGHPTWLQAHDDALIEKCALVADWPDTYDPSGVAGAAQVRTHREIAAEIRALKESR